METGRTLELCVRVAKEGLIPSKKNKKMYLLALHLLRFILLESGC
jgi:hypothetical protein